MNFQNGFQNSTKLCVRNRFPDEPRKLSRFGTICPVSILRNILRPLLRSWHLKSRLSIGVRATATESVFVKNHKSIWLGCNNKRRLEVNVTVELTSMENIESTKGAVKFVDMTAKGIRKVAVSNITVKGTDAALYKAKDEKPEVLQALGVEMEIICEDGFRKSWKIVIFWITINISLFSQFWNSVKGSR